MAGVGIIDVETELSGMRTMVTELVDKVAHMNRDLQSVMQLMAVVSEVMPNQRRLPPAQTSGSSILVLQSIQRLGQPPGEMLTSVVIVATGRRAPGS